MDISKLSGKPHEMLAEGGKGKPAVGYLPIQGEEVILQLTSSYGKQNKLLTDEQFGSITDFTWHHLSSTLIVAEIISWYNVYKLNVLP